MADSRTRKAPARANRPNPKKANADPCAIVIFGAGGDLTKRLVVPALYNLMHGGELPENFVLVGADLAEGSTETWSGNLHKMLESFVGNEAADTSNNSLNTFPSTYDALGRVFSIGLNVRF